MIKTNQISSVGWSLSIRKIWEKLQTNQQPSLKWYVKCAIQSENQQNQHQALLLLSMPKKKIYIEALRTRSSGNKIIWTETFVRSKKLAKWKTTLNRRALACYENLPIKTHLKKCAIFFVCNHNPPSSQISHFRSLHHLFSNNNSEILMTDTCHWLKPITVILGFLKIFTRRETITHFRIIIFTQSPRFQFSSPILGWIVCFL